MDQRIKAAIEAMKSQKQAMTDLLSGWTEEELKTVSYGKWNALQVLEHVITSEVGTLGYLKKKTLAPAAELPKAGEDNQTKGESLVKALKSDEKWAAPEVLPDPKGERSLEKQLGFWSNHREQHFDFIQGLDAEYYNKQVFNHPLAGRIDLYHTMEFQADHIKHHMYQLERLKAEM